MIPKDTRAEVGIHETSGSTMTVLLHNDPFLGSKISVFHQLYLILDVLAGTDIRTARQKQYLKTASNIP